MQNQIEFILNDQVVTAKDFAPEATLLDYLRLERGLVGSKEGCAEGDCGACSVLVGRLVNGKMSYVSQNTCIKFLASCHHSHVITIEHVRAKDGGLHPVQAAMLDNHGSQCGFCTPGIVMSLVALWLENSRPDARAIEVALQGNLCRCTGYEPIIRSALSWANYADNCAIKAGQDKVCAWLSTQAKTRQDIAICHASKGTAYVPASLDSFAVLRKDKPQSVIIAGATDVGLWVTKHMRALPEVIFIDHLDELRQITQDQDASGAQRLTIGAGVSYAQALPLLAQFLPQLEDYILRIGGQQVRNVGTIGGNIANGSPIGDMPPALIALDAQLVLRCGSETRAMALEDFFIDYGKQDRKAGDFVQAVQVSAPATNSHYRVYKVSKRRDEDISAVSAGFSLAMDSAGTVQAARLAYGGMAATPKRARKAEAALVGQALSEQSILAAQQALSQDFQPLSDWRASAEYRMKVAQNLLMRFYLELQDEQQHRAIA